MQSENNHSHFYSEIRLLSSGKILHRSFKLSDGIGIFLIDKTDLSKYLFNIEFLTTLVKLADIFEK